MLWSQNLYWHFWFAIAVICTCKLALSKFGMPYDLKATIRTYNLCSKLQSAFAVGIPSTIKCVPPDIKLN